MTELSLNCGAATDIGLVRDHNEDRYWMDPERGAFLVVDGVGGQAAGERAAEIAVAAIREAIGGSDHLLSRCAMTPAAARMRGHRGRQQSHLRRGAAGFASWPGWPAC